MPMQPVLMATMCRCELFREFEPLHCHICGRDIMPRPAQIGRTTWNLALVMAQWLLDNPSEDK